MDGGGIHTARVPGDGPQHGPLSHQRVVHHRNPMYETKRQSMSFVACLPGKMSGAAKFSVNDAVCRLLLLIFTK